MKQKIKRFPLAVALCLTLAVLIPFSAFAKVDQKVLDSVEQGARKNISTIMSFNKAMLQNYIDQFETNDETKVAGDLKSWQTIREDVGDVAAVGDAVAKEVDDGNILVTAKAHCGDREVVTHPGYQISSDDITELNFSRVETLGEKFESIGLNLVTGMGTVFMVLIFTTFLISRFKYIHDQVNRKEATEKEERKYKEKVAMIQRMSKSTKNVSKRINARQVKAAQVPEGTKMQCIFAPEETAVESKPVPAEIVAVLATAVAADEEPQLDSQIPAILAAAALAAEEGDPGPGGLVVKSLRRRGDNKRRRR